MNDQELISKIQLLKEVKPSEDWVLSCRAKLAFRLEMDRKKNLLVKDAFALKELFAFLGKTDSRPALVWAHSLAIALIVVLGGGAITGMAAVKSQPGTPLYPIKLAIEKARVSASLSEESRLKLQSQLADTRLEELRIVVSSQDSAELKAEKVSQVAENIQDQLNTVNRRLPQLQAKTEAKDVLSAAKMVSDKASEASKALDSAKESLSGEIKPALSVKLTEAAKIADKTNMAALETMMANVSILTATTTQEITVKLSEDIAKMDKQISAKEMVFVDKNSFADKLPIRAVLVNQFEQGLELLDKAKEALEANDLKNALEMLKAAKAIIESADQMTDDDNLSDIKGQVKGAASSTIESVSE